MSEFVEGTKFQYYATTKDKLIVYGFDDLNEVKQYCKKNNLECHNRLYLEKQKIDYNNINNWTDSYPEF
jgi:hypothetical protein